MGTTFLLQNDICHLLSLNVKIFQTDIIISKEGWHLIGLVLPEMKKEIVPERVKEKIKLKFLSNWWKSISFQISTGERTVDSPFSERPKSSHYWYPLSIHEEPHQRLHSPVVSTISNTNTNPVSSGIESRCQEQKFPINSSSTNKSFHSSYARCLNMPPMMLDQTSWLENELLETRQVSQRL